METEQGILASGKDEIYGAIFGRDSLITSLKLLDIYQQTKNQDLLRIVKKVLTTLTSLQGKEINIESGEEPGKCIHEYRPSNHEHLTASSDKPWYLYPDKIMRNYDSVDATPLLLITLYRFWQASGDNEFIDSKQENINKALDWILKYADSNGDHLVDYGLNPNRKFGGLQNQNWMDSVEATFHEDRAVVAYPIAPVEAQAYTYLAFKLWGKYFFKTDPNRSYLLIQKAANLKRIFNKKFIQRDETGKLFLASAIDAEGKPLRSIRSSMGHCLWAAQTNQQDGLLDSILEQRYIDFIVQRLLKPDIYEKGVGIRTLSKLSKAFSANSYHNGSIWPHDNSMIADGLEKFGYLKEAQELRNSILKAASHFNTPIELFVFDNTYIPYISASGQTACQNQAWSAAAIMSSVNYMDLNQKGLTLTLPTISLLKGNFLEAWFKWASSLPQVEIASLLSVKTKVPFLSKQKN